MCVPRQLDELNPLSDTFRSASVKFTVF